MKELVVITGASSGIGAATAKLFRLLGHPLLLLARRVEKMKDFEGDDVMVRNLDVTDRKAFVEIIKEAEAKYGKVGALVNNAGVMLLGQVDVQNPEEWQTMFDVNVMGLLNGIHAVLPGMKERETGTIINIGSVAGRKNFNDHAVYCGTKFGVHAISENLRMEMSKHNVRVITIAPGATETELLGHTTDENVKDGYQEWKESIGGAISADDVAKAITFAFSQPQNVCIREIVLAPTRQEP